MVRITSVEPLEGFCVRLTFTDGSVKNVDLSPYLNGTVFKPLRENLELFRRVQIDEELGTIVWENGADICPDVLYHGRTPEAWTFRAMGEYCSDSSGAALAPIHQELRREAKSRKVEIGT